MIDKEKEINNYIEKLTHEYDVNGIMICGSYIRGDYDENSDLDILFLVKGRSFEMKLEYFQNTLFDRLLVDPTELLEIITSESALSRILAHSIGSSYKVIVDSSDIQKLLTVCNDEMLKEHILYKKSNRKMPKVVDGRACVVRREHGRYYLYKGSTRII